MIRWLRDYLVTDHPKAKMHNPISGLQKASIDRDLILTESI